MEKTIQVDADNDGGTTVLVWPEGGVAKAYKLSAGHKLIFEGIFNQATQNAYDKRCKSHRIDDKHDDWTHPLIREDRPE